MNIKVLKSKITNAKITQVELYYEGSITIDEDIMNASNLVEFEKVWILNVNNGERLETYVIKGAKQSGIMCLNGPAARKAVVGDNIIILAYGEVTLDEAKHCKPKIVSLLENNKLERN